LVSFCVSNAQDAISDAAIPQTPLRKLFAVLPRVSSSDNGREMDRRKGSAFKERVREGKGE